MLASRMLLTSDSDPTCCLLPQPTAVQPCPADSHAVSPSHVQLGFADQPNCQAVSNGLYTPATQSAQVVCLMNAIIQKQRCLCLCGALCALLSIFFQAGDLCATCRSCCNYLTPQLRKFIDKLSRRKLTSWGNDGLLYTF